MIRAPKELRDNEYSKDEAKGRFESALNYGDSALNSIWPFHGVARVTVLNEDPSSS